MNYLHPSCEGLKPYIGIGVDVVNPRRNDR